MATSQPDLSADQYASILTNSQDAVVVTDRSGFVLYLNDAAAHLYGFGERVEEELESLNLQRYALDTFEIRTLSGDPVPEAEQPLTRALRGEAYQDVELLVRHRDLDETRVFVFSGQALEGDPPISVLTIRDETDRWKAERRYRTVFETDPAPSLIARLRDAQVVDVNLGMQELLGRDKSSVQGRTLVDLEFLSQNADLQDALDVLLGGDRIHKHKATLRHPDNGDTIDVLVSARYIEIEGEACGIFTYIDITELERHRRDHAASQEALVNARSRLADQREHERARIARDLHDSVLQNLLSFNTLLANEERSLGGENLAAVEISRRSRQRVLEAAQDLRRAVRDLRPPPVVAMGLWASLREWVADLPHADHPRIVLPKGPNPDLQDRKLLVLHRVAQEGIHNALKHADASEVHVTFHTTDTEAVLEVRDDGRGFDVPDNLAVLERHDHFGLLNMDERVTAHGGQLDIESAPGEGTVVRCHLPLDG